MNKDLLVASSIGFGLGLVAAIMLWVVPRVMPKNLPSDKKTDTIAESTSSTSPSTNEPLALEVTDGEVVESTDFTLKGTVTDNTLLVVATPTSYEVVTPAENGSFSAELTLEKGANHIAVTSYTSTNVVTKEVDVFYYPEKI